MNSYDIVASIHSKYIYVFYSTSKNEITLTPGIEVWVDEGGKEMMYRWQYSKPIKASKFFEVYDTFLGVL